MTLSELLKDIYESSRERIKSPIIGAYSLAFILWNWRPILILLFEDMKMIDKINLIDKEYCHFSSFFGPLLISLIITIVVPFIMIVIDWSTANPKKIRLKYSYMSKISDSEFQIDLAKQEIILQDIRSGNKEKEDFINKIKQLEEQINDINKSNQIVVENYKNQLDEIKNSFSSQSKKIRNFLNESELENFFFNIYKEENLTKLDIERFHRFPKDITTSIPFVNIGMKIINVFKKYDFLQKGEEKLNEMGLLFVNWAIKNSSK